MMSMMVFPFVLFNAESGLLHNLLMSPTGDWTTFLVGSAITGVWVPIGNHQRLVDQGDEPRYAHVLLSAFFSLLRSSCPKT
ncbi:hypothetical protein C8R43DRAFT_514162 [Mycena crocata]|nr:hypothetical protein C8R43DRAFT_514162 [Mycena crocata]